VKVFNEEWNGRIDKVSSHATGDKDKEIQILFKM
jgi:hypothetical protein